MGKDVTVAVSDDPSEYNDYIDFDISSIENRILVPIKFNNNTTCIALIDSGAVKSIIPAELLDDSSFVIRSDNSSFTGFGGGESLKSKGKVTTELEIHGNGMGSHEFSILPSKYVFGYVILGEDFLTRAGISVDTGRNRLRKVHEDGSVWDFYVNYKAQGCCVLVTEVPCYLKSNVIINAGSTRKVDIHWDKGEKGVIHVLCLVNQY